MPSVVQYCLHHHPVSLQTSNATPIVGKISKLDLVYLNVPIQLGPNSQANFILTRVSIKRWCAIGHVTNYDEGQQMFERNCHMRPLTRLTVALKALVKKNTLLLIFLFRCGAAGDFCFYVKQTSACKLSPGWSSSIPVTFISLQFASKNMKQSYSCQWVGNQ